MEQEFLWRLMHEAAVNGAAARESGDLEGYQYWEQRRQLIERVYVGVGTQSDLLELERTTKGPLEQIGVIAQWGTIGIVALLALTMFGRFGRK